MVTLDSELDQRIFVYFFDLAGTTASGQIGVG